MPDKMQSWKKKIFFHFFFWRKDITIPLKAAIKATKALEADIKSCY